MSTENSRENIKMLDRLNGVLDARGIKRHGRVKEIAAETGYSYAQASAILSGKAKLNDRFIRTLCQSYSLNEEFLRTGDGEMFSGGAAQEYRQVTAIQHRDASTEREAETLREEIRLEGGLSRKEEQVVKMFRYLLQHDETLAQTAYEDLVEAVLHAKEKTTGR